MQRGVRTRLFVGTLRIDSRTDRDRLHQLAVDRPLVTTVWLLRELELGAITFRSILVPARVLSKGTFPPNLFARTFPRQCLFHSPFFARL